MKQITQPTDFVTSVDVPSFRPFVATLENLVQEITFEVLNTPTFQGIRCDMTNTSLVAMIKDKFAALVKLPEGVERRSLRWRHRRWKTIFKNARGQTMDILRLKGSDSLTLSCLGVPKQEFKLRTLNTDNEADKLNNIETDYSLKMTTDEFKNFCRAVTDFGSDCLTIEIRSEGTPSETTAVTTYTSLICRTENIDVYRSTYRQQTRKSVEEMQFVCDPLRDCEIQPTEIDQATVLYSANFPVSFIQGFLKELGQGRRLDRPRRHGGQRAWPDDFARRAGFHAKNPTCASCSLPNSPTRTTSEMKGLD